MAYMGKLLMYSGMITVIGGLATCALVKGVEATYRIGRLEDKTGVTKVYANPQVQLTPQITMLEYGWKNLPVDKKAGMWMDGLNSTVITAKDKLEEKIKSITGGGKDE